jgi:hypothetical protein
MTLKKSISAAQRKKDPHAGPGDSFPEDAAHLKAAWDLAGHAANPDEIRRHVIEFARRHGMMDRLPASARNWHAADETIKKATGDDLKAAMSMAWMHGEDWEHRHLIQMAHERGIVKHLPTQAHGLMHEMGIPHEHENTTNQTDNEGHVMGSGHEHIITKATPKVGFFTLEKAWGEEGEDCYYEGWLSTPDKDLEKDVTEPEAFIPVLKGYFSRRAPVSVQHGTQFLPAGHLQKAVVVRDGKILATAEHPTDSADFEFFPASGSGVWVRGRLTEDPARTSVRKGNCGGLSFIGMATEYSKFPGGGMHVTKLSTLQETTVAPYPVNLSAQIAVAKAFGLSSAEDHSDEDNMSTIDEMLAKALEARKAEEKSEEPEGVSQEQLGVLFLEFEEKMLAAVEATVQKAMPARQEGVGRKGGAGDSVDPLSVAARDADPVRYMIRKAAAGAEYDEIDQKLLYAMTIKALGEGLVADDNGDDALTRALAE